MKAFFRFFAKRHLLASLLTITILLIGGFSAWRMNRSVLPKIDIGEVITSTRYPGASPEDVELNVTDKIEDEIKSITGIKRFVSTSMENSSMINITIDIDAADEERVKTEIREAIARVSDLPPEVTQTPQVTEIKTSLLPVIEVGLTSDALPYRDLRAHARQFEKKLKEVPGVASITRYGYRAREVKVEISPDNMMKYTIPMRDVIRAIEARNIRASGGSLESYTSAKNVVTLAQFRDPLEVGDVIVRSTPGGGMIRVRDLAVIKDDFERERIIPRMNGRKAIAFLVTKAENADIVNTVDGIKALVEREKTHLPETIEFVYTNDESINVRNKFKIVQTNGMIGLAMVLLVLGLFLNLRTAFWVAMGIPVSLLGTIMLLPLFDVDLDSITLTAMVLVIGIIVDDAIVISENIFYRREQGDAPEAAAVNGVHEVYQPVLTTIITTFLAFLPMFIIGGTLGRFVFVIPLTVSLALAMSLLESFLILPGHILPALRARESGGKRRPCCRTWFRPIRNAFACFSIRLLQFRYLVVFVAFGVLIGSIFYAGRVMQIELFDRRDADSFSATIELPLGASLQATSDKMRAVEALLDGFPRDEIQAYTVLVGAMADQVDMESEHLATLSVNLTPYGNRSRTAEEIVAELRQAVAGIEGIAKATFTIDVGGPPTGKPVSLRVVGDNDAQRVALADEIVSVLSGLTGFTDIARDDTPGKEEITIKFDYERLAYYGLTVADIAQNVRIAYDGQAVTSVRYGEEEVDFRVLIEQQYRRQLDYLRRLRIPNQRGELVALDEVARFDIGPGQAVFHHYDGERSITVEANVVRGQSSVLQATAAVRNAIDVDRDYPGVRLVVGGEAQETEESFIDLGMTFIIAFIGIYFLLVLLFDSLTQPFIVLLVVPFGISAVIVTFALHAQPLTFLAMIGVVGLAGVVVNDSLVLVDHVNMLRREQRFDDMATLVAMGTADRLRPIILTSLTTVAGLLPLAYGVGGRDLLVGPMALALGYGLLFATPITLILLPALYMIGHDLRQLRAKLFAKPAK